MRHVASDFHSLIVSTLQISNLIRLLDPHLVPNHGSNDGMKLVQLYTSVKMLWLPRLAWVQHQVRRPSTRYIIYWPTRCPEKWVLIGWTALGTIHSGPRFLNVWWWLLHIRTKDMEDVSQQRRKRSKHPPQLLLSIPTLKEISTTAMSCGPIAITAVHKGAAPSCLTQITVGGATYQWTSHNSRHKIQMADVLGLIFLHNEPGPDQHIGHQLESNFVTRKRTLPDQSTSRCPWQRLCPRRAQHNKHPNDSSAQLPLDTLTSFLPHLSDYGTSPLHYRELSWTIPQRSERHIDLGSLNSVYKCLCGPLKYPATPCGLIWRSDVPVGITTHGVLHHPYSPTNPSALHTPPLAHALLSATR